MGRIIGGVVVGFIVWSIIWMGSHEILALVSDRYAAAVIEGQFTTGDLIIALFRSALASVVAGWAAVMIAGEFSKTAVALGVLLLVVGILVQISSWSMFPVWYHLVFLVSLIPVTIAGGRIARK